MVYTSSSGLKKRKKNEGKGEEKNTHADCGRCALSSLGLLVERDEYWSEVAPFKGEREKEKTLLLSLCPLPTRLSVVSQDWSFIYSISASVIQHLTTVKHFLSA